MISQYPLTTLATLLALAVYFLAGALVGKARGQYDVKAPAVTGPPGFDRAFRAHQNMLEWMPLFVPALWLFAFAVSDRWAAALGFVWALARLGYTLAYSADANKRGPYFLVQFLVVGALWIGAFVGVVRSLL
ncbi:MAG: MAPEG family protein [Beijerinckiaceae bacterium]